MSMSLSIARGRQSFTTSIVRRARSQAWCANTAALLSARAKANNWLTVWVARMLDLPMCRNDCLSSSALALSRCAKSACMRKPASGVFSWWAASAKKRFWVAIESFKRSSKSFTEETKGATSMGTATTSKGLKSSGLRARMRSSSRLSGLMACARASHTKSTASGNTTNCGSMTPLTISVAKTERLSKVSATCTKAGALWGTSSLTHMKATLRSMPRNSISRTRISPTGVLSSSGGAGNSLSPLRYSPLVPKTW